MEDTAKVRDQLTPEVAALRGRVAYLEASERERQRAEEEVQLLRKRLTIANEKLRIETAERKKREEGQRFLAEASAVLSSSLDYETTLQTVARLVVPDLADWCVIHLTNGDGSFRSVAAAHVDPANAAWVRQIEQRYPLSPMALNGPAKVIHTGASELYPDIPDGLLASAAQDPEHLKIIREAGAKSAMVVPLVARGQTLGSISFVAAESGRRYDRADLALAEELSRRAAQAADNARLYEQTKRSEEALREHTQELARSNAELEQFASVASHDLQEPLRKVQAFGDLLKAKYGDVLGLEGRDYLERMQSAAGRMRNLINNLLTLSRVNTRTHPFAPVDLTRVVQGVLADLEVRIEQSGAGVEVGDLPTIEADATQMRQLLQNLISNALKFHQNGESPVVKIDGQLLKRQERLWAGQSSFDEVYQITVADNGIGFDEKYLDRIFNISQRLHSRGEFEGSGIGLAICRKIVERHHGSITARSAPGRGSTFIIVLPAKQPQGESPRLESIENPSPS